MDLTQEQLIYASLLGGKVIEQAPRFGLVENEMGKHVLPPLRILPFQNKESKVYTGEGIEMDNLWQADAPIGKDKQFFPLTILLDGVEYTLPYEPMISISGNINLIKRNVAKAGAKNIGSIKERWSQGDYEISITGALIGSIMTGDVSECFPRADFEELRNRLTAAEALEIVCEPLQLLEINRIAIESFEFPFTKGENVQAYEIKALSDFDHSLLIEIDSVIKNV